MAIEPLLQRGLLRCRIPSGGLYLWCRVMASIDMDEFFAVLEANGVSVAPGMAFEPERGEKISPHFRLCFTAVSRERLAEGIRIMGDTLEHLSASSMPAAGE